MIPYFLIFLEIYCLAWFLGIGIFALLVPQSFRTAPLNLFLIPNLGLGLLVVISVLCFYTDQPIRTSLICVLTLASSFLLIALKMGRIKRLDLKPSSLKLPIFVGILIALAIVIQPVLRAGYLTTPWRIGIDQVGYAETAHFVSDGGTFTPAKKEFLEAGQTQILERAKILQNHMISFNILAHNDFIFSSTRVGYPALIANLTHILKLDHVYRIIFFLLVFPMGLLAALLFHFLSQITRTHLPRAFFWSIAILFNCNLLNVWFEGQYAQVFTTSFAILLWLIIFEIRAARMKVSEGLFLSAFLIAVILCVYQEIFKASLSMLLLVGCLDLFIFRDRAKKTLTLLLVSSLLGSLLVFPHTRMVIEGTFYQLKAFKTSGWQHPQWANPVEILGWFDIFRKIPLAQLTNNFQPRDTILLIVESICSVFLMLWILRCFIQKKIHDWFFWIMPLILAFAIFVKCCWIEKIINYQYMKAYTMFLPISYLLVVQAIELTKSKRWVAPLIILLTLGTGHFFIKKYIREGNYVTKAMFELNTLNQIWKLKNYVIVTQQLSIAEFMLVPLIPMNILNTAGWSLKLITPDFNAPILYEVNKASFGCKECLARHSKEILFENDSIALLKTGIFLKSKKLSLAGSEVFVSNLVNISPQVIEYLYPDLH